MFTELIQISIYIYIYGYRTAHILMACVKGIPIPFSGLGSIGKEVTFHTGPLDLMGTGAGDRNPYLEMEITWTPEGAMRKKR